MDTEKYYAFISYSRKDLDVAMAICQRLESFRYPSRVEARYRPGNSRYVRDIFLDRTSLGFSQGNFHEEIRQALARSRYLIVICSRHSAVPNEEGLHNVNDEISYFLSQHGNDYGLVVPVLLDQVKTPPDLPPGIDLEAMRGRNIPICFRESREMGIDGAVAGILCYLFHMKDDEQKSLFRRLNSQRVRRFRIIAGVCMAAVVLLSVITIALFVFKAQADRSRKKADDNAREAALQSERATASAKEAERQAELAICNAEKAEKERKLAAQSLDFMVDTFKMSDPLNAGQYDLRMIDILKARIPDIARLEPWELRADVGCQVGSLLHNVGLFHEATNLLFAALELNQRRRPDSPETAYALYCASWCFFKDMSDAVSASSFARKALDIYENAPQRDPLKIALVCNALGVFYMDRDADLPKARMYLNRAFAIRQAELGDDHVEVAVVCCNLGHLYAKERSFDLAEKAYSKALQIYLRNGKESHVGVAKAWRGLGLVYFNSSQYGKAVDSFKKALEIQIRTAGLDSRHVMNLHRELGFTYRRLGEYSKARNSLKKALAVARKVAKKDRSAATRNLEKEHEEYVRAVEYLLQKPSKR